MTEQIQEQEQAQDPATRATLGRAMQSLALMEDYCDMFDRLVDTSDISKFGDESSAGAIALGLPDAQTGFSRAYIFPSATAVAYINEVELRQIRARSRVFSQLNPYARGAQRNRVAYVVGTGHTYKVLPRDPDDVDEDLLDDCRQVIEDFHKRNKWAKRQKETIRRMDRDGERFLRFFVNRVAGEMNVRFVEPLEIQNPPDKTAHDGYFFGIRFKRYPAGFDMESPEAYCLCDIDATGSATGQREEVPADQIQRLTANVDMSSPRGLTVWFEIQSHLNDAVRTLKATGKIVEFRARIGMIRRHINSTKESVQKVVDAMRNGSNGPTGVQTASRYPYASIIDTSDATEYQFPSETAPVDKNVAAIQAELRAAAAALSMPEYMLSGDASNANFASTMVAEGPAVKTFEEMQAELIDADNEVMERVLTVAAAAGKIRGATEDDILDRVKVEAEPPVIKAENKFQNVQADKILFDAGVMSKETLAARHSLEYKTECDKMEVEADEDTGYGLDQVPPEFGQQQLGPDGKPIPQIGPDGKPIPQPQPQPGQEGQPPAGTPPTPPTQTGTSGQGDKGAESGSSSGQTEPSSSGK